MRSMLTNFSEERKHKQMGRIKKISVVGFIVMLCFVCAQSFMIQGTAAPGVIDGDTYGSWEDTFEDMTGIETWDNLELRGGDIELISIPILSDDFTGTDGDRPNSTKWDLIDDGYTLEINNNRLRSYANPPGWAWEMVRTKNPLSMNHTLTWRQQLQTVGGGAYYHFQIINGSSDHLDSNNWLVGVYQNYKGEYGVYTWKDPSAVTQIGSSVSGWHDYKVIYESGKIEFYFDGVKKWEYVFNVTSIDYLFGTRILNPAVATIYTDDVLISSYSTTGNLTSTEIILPNGQTWESLVITKSEYGTGNLTNVSILDSVTYQPIPGFENLTETNIDISGIDIETHPKIRLQAHFSGNGGASPVLHSWKVTWLDTIPPATPTGLIVTNPLNGYSLILSWNPNSEPDMVHYTLYYSTSNITFYWLANISADTIAFVHEELTPGTTYYYKIIATDEVPNQSPFSEVISDMADFDTDDDGIANKADPDDDNDGYNDTIEMAEDSDPLNPISRPSDLDDDFIPDSMDSDIDGDGYDNVVDDFDYDPNEWIDSDSDGVGNNADYDDDNDGYTDDVEIADGSDPLNPSSIPADNDGDFIPDSSDPDDDNDGVPDVDDDLPFNPNEVIDTDNDSIGNNADTDDDNDGVFDANDDFPLNDSEWNDLDEDGIGDNADEDTDGDGIPDHLDAFFTNPLEWVDTDDDSIGDNMDGDIDGDRVNNINDAFPYDSREVSDLDGDSIGDNSDRDRDGDGVSNGNDSFPDNALEREDTDNDGKGDNADTDDDGDGYPDINDAFPYDDTEWSDLDMDGIGDNSDDDKDGDSVLNTNDEFSTNDREWKDSDEDGIGDNGDLDDDNDGHPDTNDDYPHDSSRWLKPSEPNELVLPMYIIMILLVILILIGVILMVMVARSQRSGAIRYVEQPLPQPPKEETKLKEAVPKEVSSEEFSQEMGEPTGPDEAELGEGNEPSKKKSEERELPPPPPLLG